MSVGPSSAAAVSIGVRATKTQNVINRASERVVERITLETMEQSFPDLLENDSDRDFIRLLTERTADHLRAGFQEAWADLFTNSHYKTFIAKSNEVDDIVADASQRAQRGEAPLDAWKRGRDPELAIAAAMIPKLQAHLETVREARESLQEQVDAKLRRAQTTTAEADVLEGEIHTLLSSIQEASAQMESINGKALQQQLDALIPLIGMDKL